MKSAVLLSGAVALFSGAAYAEELCTALTDTALYADAALSEEIRPVFQFDGAQFVPSGREGAAIAGMAYDVRMQPMLEGPSYIRAADWACEGLAGSGAAPAVQAYDLAAEDCGDEMSDSRVVLGGAEISFYESSCDILTEAADAAGARVLSLQCRGEGSEWPAEAVITARADGGMDMVIDGFAQSYVACD